MFRVCETFVSISGESSWQGLTATFIRFSGCDVECAWCDTVYAREEEGAPASLEDLLALCRANRVKRVILTGGEPLLQEEVPALCERLLAEGFEVQVETSGTLPVDRLPEGVMKVIDIKPPSAAARRDFLWGNLDRLGENDEIKLVLADRRDYEWALPVLRRTGLDRSRRVLLSTVAGRLEPSALAAWMIEDGLSCRLQVQLHKVLWPQVNRGR